MNAKPEQRNDPEATDTSLGAISGDRSAPANFRTAVEAGDLDRAVGLLSEQVVFRSPIVFRPYQGKETVRHILQAVSEVFDDFRYLAQIGDGTEPWHALMFSAGVGERELDGCDFLHVDEQGQIDELWVMVRPLSGALALAEAMKEKIAAFD